MRLWNWVLQAAKKQQARGTFFIGCFSVWRAAAVKPAAVSALLDLVWHKWIGRKTLTVSQLNLSDTLCETNTEWQTGGQSDLLKASKVKHFCILPTHLLQRHSAKQALKGIDHEVRVHAHCTGYIQNTDNIMWSYSLLDVKTFDCLVVICRKVLVHRCPNENICYQINCITSDHWHK